jgi:hypothetical protein
LVQHTKTEKHVPNDTKIYQIAVKYTKWPQNIPKTLSIPRPSKIFPNWDFWYENTSTNWQLWLLPLLNKHVYKTAKEILHFLQSRNFFNQRQKSVVIILPNSR